MQLMFCCIHSSQNPNPSECNTATGTNESSCLCILESPSSDELNFWSNKKLSHHLLHFDISGESVIPQIIEVENNLGTCLKSNGMTTRLRNHDFVIEN